MYIPLDQEKLSLIFEYKLVLLCDTYFCFYFYFNMGYVSAPHCCMMHRVNAKELLWAFMGMQMDDYSTSSLNYIIGQGDPFGALPKFLTDSFGAALMKNCAHGENGQFD